MNSLSFHEVKTLLHNHLLETEGIFPEQVAEEGVIYTPSLESDVWIQEEFSDFRMEFPASGIVRIYGVFLCRIHWKPGTGAGITEEITERLTEKFHPFSGRIANSTLRIQPYSLRKIDLTYDENHFSAGIRISFFASRI